MNLAILGATGRVGRHLTREALHNGHNLVAVMRNSSALHLKHSHLSVVEGDVRNPEIVDRAIEHADVVLCALGDRNLHGKITLLSDAMTVLLPEMKAKGINRIIVVAGAGILQHDPEILRRDAPGYPPFLLSVSEDHLRVFHLLEKSELDWTLVCPPQILDGKASDHYEVKADYFPGSSGRIFAGDIAAFILNEMIHNLFLRKRVGIAN